MERDARYLLVGVLLLLSIAGGIVFAIWSANVTDESASRIYTIQFRSSVSGLNTGSNVYYLGVPVGRVSRLSLAPPDTGGVLVRIAVQPETPVTAATTAQLSTSGLTGQSSIELNTPEGSISSGDILNEETLIQGEGSVIGKLAKAAPAIADQTGSALNRMNLLLSDENIGATGQMLSNMAEAASEFDKAAEEMQVLLAEMRRSNADFQAVLPNFDAVALRMRDKTLPEFEQTSVELRQTSRLIAQQMTDNSQVFRDFIADSRMSMFIIRDQILQTAQKAEQFTEELRNNPSRLIYKPRQTGLEFDE